MQPIRKVARTISGVSPVAVMAAPVGCPGKCLYCPTFPDIPQSYTPGSPAVLRARRHGFDPRLQVMGRLSTLREMGHPVDKVEIIVMGGTFLASSAEYQEEFIKGCYEGLNGVESPSLEEAQLLNQGAGQRCVGLCIETRPDWCGEEEIRRMLRFGATRVELGVQTLDDAVYSLIGRGHTVADVAAATQRLKQHGFKVHYHWMPGLPGVSPEQELELFSRLWCDERFRPDGLKLYPTLVVADTRLEEWFRQGRYQPYEGEGLVELVARMKAMLPEYVRVSRIMRDIPPQFVVAGCKHSNLGEMVKRKLQEMGMECRCIRCREYGHRLWEGWEVGEPKLVRRDYPASGGTEVMLSMEDEGGTLFGLLRLRYPWQGVGAIVRELHVYGPEVGLGQREDGAAQHRGLGVLLLREAERIASEEFYCQEIAILSGVGAGEYYRNLGYKPGGFYLHRPLAPKGVRIQEPESTPRSWLLAPGC